MNEQRVTLDLSKNGGHERIRIGRWDMSGTTICASINDGGNPVDLDGMDVTVVMLLSDGTVLELTCDTDENKATVTLNESDIAECSVTLAYVCVEDSGHVYSTDRFGVDVFAGRGNE